MSQTSQRDLTRLENEKRARLVHTAALVSVVACPLLALLPPRRFNFSTLVLIGTTAYSANHLLRESTGRIAWQHVSLRERETQRSPPLVVPQQARGEHSARGAWKSRREQEIKQDVEEGKGFGDMIMDQIWEVWNWGKPKEDDD